MSELIDAAAIFALRRSTAAQQRAHQAEQHRVLERIEGFRAQLMDEQRDRLSAGLDRLAWAEGQVGVFSPGKRA